MTQTTDTQTLHTLRYQAQAVQKFCNSQGRFWHRASLGERPASRPSDQAKGNAYDGAWHLTRLFDLPRASSMLDLLAALDAYNAAVQASGDYSLRTLPVKPANRAAIVRVVTPR